MTISLSIIIVNYNTKKFIEGCLTSIYKYPPSCEFEIVVVDNNSQDGSYELISQVFKDVRLIKNNRNVGFSRANNQAVSIAKGKYLLLLNSDTEVVENSLSYLMHYAESNQNCSAIGPQLLNGDGSFQRSFFNFPTPLKTVLHMIGITPYLYLLKKSSLIRLAFRNNKPAFLMDIDDFSHHRKVDYLILAAFLIRRDSYNLIGGLDEHLFFYNEDSDIGYKLRKLKMEIRYIPEAKIIHYGGSSSTSRNIINNNLSYYIGVMYISKKHENIFFSVRFRMSVTMGALIRIVLIIVGVRTICPIGIYGNSAPIKLSFSALFSLYCKLILAAVFMKNQIK